MTQRKFERIHDRILRDKEVEERTGLKRTARYKGAKAGTFPAPRKITPYCNGWLESEIEAWIKSRPVADFVTDKEGSE